jgi:hypothetical protein
MSLTKTINKSIEKTIVSFTQEISEKYGMSQDELLEIWSNISKMKMKTTEKKKKLSPWLKFCKNERVRIKKQDPSIPFGQISKMIGDIWKTMSDEDKKNYGQDDTTIEETSSTTITKIDAEDNNMNNWNEQKLKKMKISELRSLCENIQLSKTGKKEVLIVRLLNCKKMSSHEKSDDDDDDDDDVSCDFNKDEEEE